MEKTKLGLSAGLMGTIAFLCGYMGFTLLALVCGYILIREESQELRKNASYAIVLAVAFALLSLAISTLQSLLSTINVNSWMSESGVYNVIRIILSTCMNIIGLAEKIVFGVLAVFCALGKSRKIAFLDKFLAK